jgi:glutamyl-tRNA synthetase
MRVRFAPSPTGLLHVGNARTALFNWLLARGRGGTFVLRIEDTDVERSTPESEQGILNDLRWLGLDWDEGPDVGGPHGPYRQSERLDLYRSYAHELVEQGHAYHCFCSAEQLEADRRAALESGRPPQYSGRCRDLSPSTAAERLASGHPAVVRFRVPQGRTVAFQDVVRGTVQFETEVIGDPVLVRSDGHPAYNFAVVIDDALMEITHVVRGEDHISNTPRQVLLYEALKFQPPVFAHLALVLGPDHTPLSKRHGATSVSEFRTRGYLPEALVNYLALLGWSPGGGDEVLPAP